MKSVPSISSKKLTFDWRRLRDKSQEQWNNLAWRVELAVAVQNNFQLREDGRRVFQNNLLAACWILGWMKVDEDIHRDALEFFAIDTSLPLEEQSTGNPRRGSLLLPRGVYKSTISMANCVRLISLWAPTIAILVLCGGKDLALAFVDTVAQFFVKPRDASPTLFQALFPELCVDAVRTKGNFTAGVRQQQPPIVEPTIWGSSVESGLSGWHPNVFIVDDAVNNRNAKTHDSRKYVTSQYKMIRKVLVSTGIEHKIGTLYGVGDIFSDEVLTTRPGTYRRICKPAMALKSGARLDTNGFPEEEEVILNFPTILPYSYLREEYESGTESFFTQFMLDEYGANEVVFEQSQILDAMVDITHVPLEGDLFIHWRLPCSAHRWKDAAGVCGVLHHNRCYVLDVAYGNYRPSALARKIHDFARKHGQHRIFIEDTPGARHMQPTIQNYCLSTGWNIELAWLDYENEPGERDTRIRSMEAEFNQGRLVIADNLREHRNVVMQLTQYGMSDDFAIPDVLSRLVGNLPVSLSPYDEEQDDLAWEQMKQRDMYNAVYNRGLYAPPEPEPEELEPMAPEEFEEEYLENGLPNIMPGLNG